MQQKLNWHGDFCTNGENLHSKNPTQQKPYKVILKSSLLRIHYYQNKWLQIKELQYLIPTYSWTLIPIINWTFSVMIISLFQCTVSSMWLTNCADPSTRLDHQLKKDVGCKVLLIHQTMKIMKFLGHKTICCTNTADSSRTRAN